MKYLLLLIMAFAIALKPFAQQRVIAECTITYAISVDSTSTDNKLVESLKYATKTVYIKGNNCRTDLISPAFTQSVFYNKAKASATILREFGSNKFITILDSFKWLLEHSEFDSMKTIITNDTRKIVGYDCKKALLQLKNGKVYELYFTSALLPSVREFEYEFKDIPGLVLAYEVQSKDGKKVFYTATKINLSPVSASRFDIPTTGYRFLEK
ncbi:MAG: hypothetical protein H7068_12870 [Pedobacter sp.]|nr:hypothetical protein [Chitinophagaceae bacterium]